MHIREPESVLSNDFGDVPCLASCGQEANFKSKAMALSMTLGIDVLLMKRCFSFRSSMSIERQKASFPESQYEDQYVQ